MTETQVAEVGAAETAVPERASIPSSLNAGANPAPRI